ncbi:MAG: rhodanese-like domain-containing protein [Bryobacteraceae bacterium]
MPEPLELSPKEVRSRVAAGDRLVFIDVRDPEEIAMTRIEGAQLIPMESVPAEIQRLEALADEASLVILCHHGVRSLQVASWLRQQGLDNCSSLAGGIDRWSREIDPTVPRY